MELAALHLSPPAACSFDSQPCCFLLSSCLPSPLQDFVCPVSPIGPSHSGHGTALLRASAPLWSAEGSGLCCYPVTSPVVHHQFSPTGFWSRTTLPVCRAGHRLTSISTPSHFWEELGGLILQPKSSLSILNDLGEGWQ